MPTRLIREGWLESEAINALDAPGERFFLRLCLRADDFGRFHANPLLLKSSLFPLREDVRSADISRWLAACEKSGMVRCYSDSGKPYLVITKFGQRARAEKSKFPEPPPDDPLLPGISLTEVSHKGGKNKHTPGTSPPDAGTSRAVVSTPPASARHPPPYAEAKPTTLAPSASPSGARADLFKSIAIAEGSVVAQLTKPAEKRINAALDQILRVFPQLTAAEIDRRALRYHQVMPAGTRLTAHALAMHWAKCGSPANPNASVAISEPKDWREKLERKYPGNAINAEMRGWSDVPPQIQAELANQ